MSKTSCRMTLSQYVDTYEEAIKLREEFIKEIEKHGLKVSSESLYASPKYPPYDAEVKVNKVKQKPIGMSYSIRVEGTNAPDTADSADEMFPY